MVWLLYKREWKSRADKPIACERVEKMSTLRSPSRDMSGMAFTQKRIEMDRGFYNRNPPQGMAFMQKRIEIEPGRLDICLDVGMAFIQKRIEIRLQS